MVKENSFYNHLFEGINSFLENAQIDCVERFLAHCSKQCSESYSKKVFIDNIRLDEPIEKSLERLEECFDGFSYKVNSEKITLLLTKCGCDLVNDKLIHSPKLCICSEKSILLNWEAVFGVNNVKIKKIRSILEGSEVCEFDVRIKQLGNHL
jgi:hypothetical protein